MPTPTPTLKLSASGLEKVFPKLEAVLKEPSLKKNLKGPKPDLTEKLKKKKQAQLHDPKEFLKKRNKTLMWLCNRYPKCFSVASPLPLKIGIILDIYEIIPEAISRTIIRKVLKRYTNTKRYLDALLSNPKRYNLDGEIVGEVGEKERSFAQSKIDSFIKRE